MRKLFATALATAACALGTGAANASDVFWSIGISAPPIATVISNSPGYGYGDGYGYGYSAPAPAYYPGHVYAPPPRVVYRPAPVVVVPRPFYHRPAPVVVHRGWGPPHSAPQWGQRRDGRDHDWRDRDGRRDNDWRDRDGRRDEYGDRQRGDRWAPADPRRQPHR